jgi:D-alanine-D-alanine ligase
MADTEADGGRDGTRPRVVVVFGGRSSEHAISCVTAGGVLGVIDRNRYDVVAIGITRDGRWVLASDDPAAYQVRDGRLPEVRECAAAVALVADPTRRSLVLCEPSSEPQMLAGADVVLPLLHGPFGEDGTIQGLLEMAGVPYVGSGVFASAAAMDKQYMKLLLTGSGLPDIPHVVVRPGEWDADPSTVRESVTSLGFPVFVKPARGGSSIGISEVERLAAAAFEALSCAGLARVDFFVTPDRRVLVNEVNTMPGFTPTSVFPRVWAASGLDYPALVDRLIETALRRSPGLR